MKNTSVTIMAWLCLVLAAFLGGLFLGRNYSGQSIQTSVLAAPTIKPSTAPSSGTAPSKPQSSGKININTADLQTLMTLPGIGEIYAQRIIDYRTAHGRFTDINQLKEVEGIGEKRFEAIKDYITTGG